MIGDKDLDEVVKWKQEIRRRENILKTIDDFLENKNYRNINNIIIGYDFTYGSQSSHCKFNSSEDEIILKKTLKYYKVLQYFKIIELSNKIKKVLPSYTITDPIIIKAINEQENMRREISNDSLGDLGKILFKYV